MAANKPDFSLGRVDTPDVGGELLDFADRQQKQYQTGLSNAVEADKLLRDRQRFAREQELNTRVDTEYNREVSGRKALQDYASKPLDISTMLGTQTKTADEAIAADTVRRVALWDKSLADNNITQDDVDKGRVSKELLGKLYNPALDVNASTGIQKTYESITPFREDVESRVEKDLIAQNVDPLKAKQYAQMEGQKYQSIPEYQAMLTAQAEKMTNNSKEQFKDNLELTKFNREVYKDELDKYKIKMDNLTKMMGSTGSGGTGGGGLLSQDKSKAYDEVYAKAGNSTELASKLDAAFQVYGAKAVNNALAASGINEPVRLLEFDVGKRDASLERFDNALKNEKPLSEVQSQFGSGAPNAPTYSLPTPATVYTADSARAAAQDRVKNSVLGYLGDSAGKGVTATGTTAEVNPNVPLSGGGKSVLHINGVPDSLILNEGLKTDKDGMFRSYIDTNTKGENKGLAVAGGYNYSNKSPQEIKSDFKAAGISDAQAEAAINKEPIKLSEQQGKDLFAVGYKRMGVEKASKLLPEYKDMNPFIKEIAADMAYRGDLVPGSNGYQGDLVKALKTNDVNKVYDYVNNNNIPVEVKQRLGNILTVERDSSWYEGGSKKAETNKEKLFDKVDVKGPSSTEIRGQMDELNSQGINSKEDEIAFNKLQAQYKLAKANEIKNEPVNPIYKMNAPQLLGSLLGIKTNDNPKVVAPVSEKTKLLENPDASKLEEGLEDRTMDFVPFGLLSKAKGLKSTSYDDDILSAVTANTKSGGLNINNKLLEEIYGNSPLAISKNISEFNKPVQKMTSAVREELINYASQLRSIKNPTVQQEEMLNKINETLRNTR